MKMQVEATKEGTKVVQFTPKVIVELKQQGKHWTLSAAPNKGGK